ncbi:aromatic amino acid lyase [Pikeienuella piscinae]|uniref:Aromatic amino acid lyase n=1 Tax=Pikeienuella piscinae TaxID=2748098 RepID=A0A7M3T687_9RHOB|nr:aromatic amino acid lyase [Pikeienuella piscinae]
MTSDFGPNAKNRVDAEARRRRAAGGMPFLGLSLGDRPLGEAEVRSMYFAMLALVIGGAPASTLRAAKAVEEALNGPQPEIPDGGLTSPGEILPMFYLMRGAPDLMRRDPEEVQASQANSACSSTGMAALAAIRARRRMALAHKVFALSAEAILAPLEHFDPALKPLWGDPHEAASLDSFARWLAGATTEGRRPYQAPVSWRILPRVLGQGNRGAAGLIAAAERALAGMVSNPSFIEGGPDAGAPRAVSTGGYHNAITAQAVETVMANWVDIATLAQRQVVKLHRGDVSGLPDRLLPEGEKYWTGRSTSYIEFVGNDIIDDMRRLGEPALLSPAEAGASLQDDVSAPGLIACRNEAKVAVLFDRMIGILAATASHALHIAGRDPAPPLSPFLAAVRRRFPPVIEKRVLGEDAARLAAALTDAANSESDLLTDDDMADAALAAEDGR